MGRCRERPEIAAGDVAPREETCDATARAAVEALEYAGTHRVREMIFTEVCVGRREGEILGGIFRSLRELVREHPIPSGTRMYFFTPFAENDEVSGLKKIVGRSLDLSEDAPHPDADGFDWSDVVVDQLERVWTRCHMHYIIFVVGSPPFEFSLHLDSFDILHAEFDYPQFSMETNIRGEWLLTGNRSFTKSGKVLTARAESIATAVRVLELLEEYADRSIIIEDTCELSDLPPFICDFVRYEMRDRRTALFDARILKTLVAEYSLARYREKLGFFE